MSKFPVSRLNTPGSRSIISKQTNKSPPKQTSEKNEPQTTQATSYTIAPNSTSTNNNSNEHPITPSNNPPTTNTSKSFDETTAKSTYPKMSQAIVLNTIDGVRQVEYITAISKIVEPRFFPLKVKPSKMQSHTRRP
jgi:hypothetical protein